jgi:predicted kinase
MVRAKVALLRAEQHDAQAWAAFERDLGLAEALAAPRVGPQRLVATCGVSGSGKSTVAQMLVEAIGAIRIRSDVERKRLFGLAATERPDAPQTTQLYGSTATQRTYARLDALASALLDAGLQPIVDAAFLRREEREGLRAVAAAHGAWFTLIECHAPNEVLRERVRRRLSADNDASDANLSVLAMQLQRREPAGDDERPCRLDTNVDLDTLRGNALHALGIA